MSCCSNSNLQHSTVAMLSFVAHPTFRFTSFDQRSGGLLMGMHHTLKNGRSLYTKDSNNSLRFTGQYVWTVGGTSCHWRNTTDWPQGFLTGRLIRLWPPGSLLKSARSLLLKFDRAEWLRATRRLLRFGMNRYSLFPDLDGLSGHLYSLYTSRLLKNQVLRELLSLSGSQVM